jgi:hypothetical protein
MQLVHRGTTRLLLGLAMAVAVIAASAPGIHGTGVAAATAQRAAGPGINSLSLHAGRHLRWRGPVPQPDPCGGSCMHPKG